MNSKIVICLYLKGYLNASEFENYFYNNMDKFQKDLPNEIYEEVVCTNFSSKELREGLTGFLKQYIISNDKSTYDNISDAYVELLINKNKCEITNILKEKSEPKEKIVINCAEFETEKEFIQHLKKELNLSTSSGLNWIAMNDLLHDIIFPKNLVFIDWNNFERRLPQCAQKLKDFLSYIDRKQCNIIGVK